MVYFLDSSAVVKRYVQEIGTAWVNQLFLHASLLGNRFYLARISRVEVIAAIARRGKGGTIPSATSATLIAQFHRDLGTFYRTVAVTPQLIDEAMALAEAHALRGYDAVQLAAALRVNAPRNARGLSAITLVSSDAELNAAAVAEGLAVDDPNSHP